MVPSLSPLDLFSSSKGHGILKNLLWVVKQIKETCFRFWVTVNLFTKEILGLEYTNRLPLRLRRSLRPFLPLCVNYETIEGYCTDLFATSQTQTLIANKRLTWGLWRHCHHACCTFTCRSAVESWIFVWHEEGSTWVVTDPSAPRAAPSTDTCTSRVHWTNQLEPHPVSSRHHHPQVRHLFSKLVTFYVFIHTTLKEETETESKGLKWKGKLQFLSDNAAVPCYLLSV